MSDDLRVALGEVIGLIDDGEPILARRRALAALKAPEPPQPETSPDLPCEDEPWCCGCSNHPIGKPYGWNVGAWLEHTEIHHRPSSEDWDALIHGPHNIGYEPGRAGRFACHWFACPDVATVREYCRAHALRAGDKPCQRCFGFVEDGTCTCDEEVL